MARRGCANHAAESVGTDGILTAGAWKGALYEDYTERWDPHVIKRRQRTGTLGRNFRQFFAQKGPLFSAMDVLIRLRFAFPL